MRGLLLSAALLALPFAAAGQWVEGVHYERVETPDEPRADGKIEVVEVLWYACPTCYNLEPWIERWLETKPDDVEFVRIHASLSPTWRIPARAFYAAEALGVTEKVHRPLFDAIHIGRDALNDVGTLVRIFEEHADISPDAFRAAYSSFGVDRRMRQGDQRVRQFRVSGVPTLIINGKYRTTPGRAKGYRETIQLIDHLIEQERNP
ncbi:MAG: thiol:disulfide interchange protein DsbA/DsbL [Gammaproteobacteria bacterium]